MKAAAARRAPALLTELTGLGDETRLAEVRRQLANEVTLLQAAWQAPAAERAQLLADLATRIDAALAWLTGGATPSGDLAELTQLANKLRDCDQPGGLPGTDLDPLWEEAIRTLTAFTAPSAPDSTQEQQPGTPDPAFWKRPR
jgi:hypothetical protein